MNILAPVDSAREAEMLLKSGATELFCGYIPQEWYERYQVIEGEHVQSKRKTELLTVSLNKRNNVDGNVRSREELTSIVQAAKNVNAKVFVTLNAFYYTDKEYDYIEKYVEELIRIGVCGFIVTDVALISFIRNKFPDAYLVLSCCNQVANTYSAKFFEELGIDRITFPRHVTIDEMISISENVPDVDYECFILDSRCIYDDGNCRAMHNLGHFCMEQWDYEYFRTDRCDIVDYNEIESLRNNEIDFIMWSKPYTSLNATNNGWFAISCAACAVPILMNRSNIKTLKIAGRGLDTNSKVMMVRTVRKMIAIASKEKDVVREKEYICKLVGVPELCNLQSRCLMPSLKYN